MEYTMTSTDTEAMDKHIELIRYLADSLLGGDVVFDVAGTLLDDRHRRLIVSTNLQWKNSHDEGSSRCAWKDRPPSRYSW